jgi:hypothetical protein
VSNRSSCWQVNERNGDFLPTKNNSSGGGWRLPRAYLPLKTVAVAYPYQIKFANGVCFVFQDDFPTSKLEGWQEVFSGQELRDIRQWHLALACEWNAEADNPEVQLANARLALQVAAPIGTFLSVCVRESGDKNNPNLVAATRFPEFRGTPWSRMRGFNGMSHEDIQSISNGVIRILEKNDARTTTPLRLLEQGLVSSDPYIRIFLWVTAIDSILMAVTEEKFVRRLYALLGDNSKVFPPEDGVYIQRATVVGDVARDLFELRSQVAHGRPIGQRFWESRQDLESLFDPSVYVGPFRYRVLLEEASLSLLCRILRKMALEGLVSDFMVARNWKTRLDRP